MLQASSPWPSGTVSGVFFEQRRWEELYEYLGCIENGQSFGALKGDVTSGRLKKTVLWFGSVKPHVKTIKRSNAELLQASSPWPSGTVSGVFFEQRRWEELYEYLGCIENGQSFGALKGDVTSGRLKKTVLWFGSVKPHVKTIKRSNAELLQASSPWPSGTVSGVFFEQRRWEELYEYLGCIENGQSFGALKGDVTSGRLKKTVLWFGSVKPHVKTIKRSNAELLQASSKSGPLWHRLWGVNFEQRRWEELYEYLGCIENGQSFGALKGDRGARCACLEHLVWYTMSYYDVLWQSVIVYDMWWYYTMIWQWCGDMIV